jgi:hypothetical protein
MEILFGIAATLLLMFIFRLEGGGFYQFGNDTTPRIIRSLVFAGIFAFMTHVSFTPAHEITFSLFYLFTVAIMSFLASNVGHGFYQGMGSEPAPQSFWWSFWLNMLHVTSWATWPMWRRIAWDFSGMAGVGLVCGVISYIPYIALTHEVAHFCYAVLSIGLLQPLAYLIGRGLASAFPFLKIYSTEYGEALTGAAWFASLIALTI